MARGGVGDRDDLAPVGAVQRDRIDLGLLAVDRDRDRGEGDVVGRDRDVVAAVG